MRRHDSPTAPPRPRRDATRSSRSATRTTPASRGTSRKLPAARCKPVPPTSRLNPRFLGRERIPPQNACPPGPKERGDAGSPRDPAGGTVPHAGDAHHNGPHPHRAPNPAPPPSGLPAISPTVPARENARKSRSHPHPIRDRPHHHETTSKQGRRPIDAPTNRGSRQRAGGRGAKRRKGASTLKAWVLASRPATLPAAAAPVIVGSALAFADDVFDWLAFIVILFAALAIQIGVNFANDLADAEKGADTEARIGPTRAVASGLLSSIEMKKGIAVAFGLASIAGIYLIWLGGWPILAIGVISIIAALGYTNGPVPYGYRGLGEVFVFVFFGLVATVGTRFVYDRTAPADAWIGGVAVGLLAAAILVANNVRDIDTDRDAGKRTLAVILGRQAGRWLYAITVLGAYLTVGAAVAGGILPVWSLATVVSLPLGIGPIRTIFTETAGPPLIGVLKATARLQLVFAALLAAGILVGA
ncbi:MAG: 1,4-dihydroxy-2-naphthoate polyprenyltransferase [Actinomycetota bacterium]